MSHLFFPRFRNLPCLFMMAAIPILSACAPVPATVNSHAQTPGSIATRANLPSPTATATFTALPPTVTPIRVASSSADCASLRSLLGDDLTSITFENWSGHPVNIYFVDPEGVEQFYFELQPGQSGEQVTYVTHAWCVRDKISNEALLAVVATENESVATILRDIQWQETNPIPNASSAPFDSLRSQQLVFHNNRVYLIGGRSANDDRLTDVYFSAVNPDGSLAQWKETTPLPGKYYDHVTVKVGEYVYMLTGADGQDDVFFAPINTDGTVGEWKITAPLSPSRQTFAAASDRNFIYATGGNSGGTKNFVHYTSVNADGSLDPWGTTRSLPKAVQEHAMLMHDGYLYVIGGRNSNDGWVNTIYFSAIQPDGTLSDWMTTESLPELGSFAAFESNGYFYLLGDRFSYYTRVLEDHTLSEWQRIPSLPAVRNGLRVGAQNSYAYAIGGFDFAGHQSTVYHTWLGSVLEHTDCTSGWTRLKPDSYAKVSEDRPSPNRVREAPHTGAEIIHQAYPGDIIRVLEGPVCANGLVFWKVENARIPGGAGWTAEGDGKEYYLEPIE